MDKGFSLFNGRLLNRSQLLLLSGLLTLAVLPHFFHLSLPVSSFFSAIILLRLISIQYSLNLPRWLIIIFMLAGLVIVITQYSGTIGKDFGVSMLVAMLGLKILEIKNYRDAYVLLFLTGFMLVTQFLYNQDMLLTLYIFSLTISMLFFLLWLNDSQSKPAYPAYFKTVFRLSLQAFPVMLIMFLFFPRLSGPLWGIDTESSTAVTGISGRITPGSISRLSQSSATAFRVRFDQPEDLPEAELRYWRGPVMVNTDGISWLAEEEPQAAEVRFQSAGEPVSYQLTLEASRQNWIFALDLPGVIPANTYVTAEYSVRSDRKIIQRSTFALTSYPLHFSNLATDEELSVALSLPDNITPRMRDLAAGFKRDSQSAETYVNKVLEFFNQQNFIYSLRPPLMQINPADQFLFDTRKGFCEHYASSFVLLMRLGNIPARIVAGYQGGEWNPAGQHLILRQSDAHAWAEVWLDGKGWTRVDPTAAVAPERIQMSIDPDAVAEGSPVVFKLGTEGMFGNLLRQAVWMADSLDLNWHRWIVGFSKQRQQYFMDSSGLGFLKNYTRLALAGVFLAMLFILVLVFVLRKKTVKVSEPAKIYWDCFCKKLVKKGVVCQATEGPETIAANACKQLPDKAASIRLITDLYISIRYAGKYNSDRLKHLRQLIARFN